MSVIASDRYALIIGSMKCATTSLFSYLAEHPAICPASIKEPEFFSRHQGHRREIARYEDLWDFDPERHRYAMEASTGYTKFAEMGVAAAIHAHGLRPRLIYILRDPFERIESHYNFMLQDPVWRRDILDPNIVQTSNYHLFVQDYVRVFGAESLLLLDYDELSADPRTVVNRSCAFLGIPEMETIADLSARNVTDRPKSGLERAVRRLAPGFAGAAPQAIKQPLRQAFAAIRPQKAKLGPAQRDRVAEALAPGMARLHVEHGVDVARWGF